MQTSWCSETCCQLLVRRGEMTQHCNRSARGSRVMSCVRQAKKPDALRAFWRLGGTQVVGLLRRSLCGQALSAR